MNHNNVGSHGDYWSSTYYDSTDTWSFGFNSSSVYQGRGYRRGGFPIRPVTNPKTW